SVAAAPAPSVELVAAERPDRAARGLAARALALGAAATAARARGPATAGPAGALLAPLATATARCRALAALATTPAGRGRLLRATTSGLSRPALATAL